MGDCDCEMDEISTTEKTTSKNFFITKPFMLSLKLCKKMRIYDMQLKNYFIERLSETMLLCFNIVRNKY